MEEYSEKALKKSRTLYIIEAAVEYLISILVASSFLATLTKELGMSDSLTGILSSVISLGCLFQLLSLTVQRRRVKKFVVVMSVINQILFMLLYVIPLAGFGKQLKIAAFVVVIFVAYIIYNFAHPKKMNWLISLVDDHQRGRFTANKEIVSLIAGIVFSFSMGAVVDWFAAANNMRMAFTVSALVIFVLMVFHTIVMIHTVEKETPVQEQKNVLHIAKNVFKNKNVLQVTVVSILYYIINYSTLPFFGTYQIGELGFSLTFTSAIAMVGSVSRILVSRFWGKYADKNSFAAMVEKCFIFFAISLLSIAFAVPSNGKIMFVLYHIFHGISMGGINSALTNLVFDYVEPENRADSLAICQASSGLVGFLTTLAVSPLVSLIQKNGNTLFGIPIYAQQFLSLIGILFLIVAIIYLRTVIMKKDKMHKKEEQE